MLHAQRHNNMYVLFVSGGDLGITLERGPHLLNILVREQL